MDPVNVRAKFEVCTLTRSWDDSDWSFGWGLQTPNLREEEVKGVGDGTVRKSIGEFIWALHSNFSSIFTRFREIVLLLFSSTPLFPTPPLVSTKFPHVPLGVRRWSLGYEERRSWVIVHAVSFQHFPSMWSWSANVTNGQRDDMRSQYRALHYSVSCGKKTVGGRP